MSVWFVVLACVELGRCDAASKRRGPPRKQLSDVSMGAVASAGYTWEQCTHDNPGVDEDECPLPLPHEVTP